MSTDYAEKEREFLDSLAADTGRDLAGWMKAIDEASLAHRNDIIDWLRLQGFLFARASWLERIHNNGGKPLYAGKPPGKVLPARRTRSGERPFPTSSRPSGGAPLSPPPEKAPVPMPPAATAPATSSPVAPAPVAVPPPPAPPPALASATAPPSGLTHSAAPPDAQLDEALARAKAFRPLAQYLLRTVERACPGTAISVREGNVSLARPQPYALVLVSPRDLRLVVDLGGDATGTDLMPARLPGIEARFRHMLVLTDARQLNSDLESLLRVADANVNGAR